MTEPIYPPTILPVSEPVIFLAGPIQGAPEWQRDAISWFAAHAPHIRVASPRRSYLPGEFDYAGQVDWETHYLRLAATGGCILFWLACEVTAVVGRAYAQTTRFELAEWKVRHERDNARIVVGIEKGFTGERYIRRRFGQDCPAVPILTTLDETCQAALTLIGSTST